MATVTANTSSHHHASVICAPVASTVNIDYPFWFGGNAAAMAACITHPLDLSRSSTMKQIVLKVRLQTLPPGSAGHAIRLARQIVADDGFRGLYAGLTAALMRQMTYSTVRFGVYEELKAAYRRQRADQTPTSSALAFMAGVSGVLGGIVGNPADVLLVRMQSDNSKPPRLRKYYRNAFNALARISRDEGAAGLFRGVGPNAGRAGLMTASQLASYDVFKAFIAARIGLSEDLRTHLAASLGAGLVATTVCSPVDVIKTRIMADHSQGLKRVLRDAIRDEGLFWAFKGWWPSFVRLRPQTMLTLVILEQLKALYRHLKL